MPVFMEVLANADEVSGLNRNERPQGNHIPQRSGVAGAL
jgi:hypothetical protein